MTPINFHDINFWIGENNLSKKYSVAENKVIEILAERKKNYSVTGTTITHFNSYFYYPSSGNDLLSALLEKICSAPAAMQPVSPVIYGAMLFEHETIAKQNSFEKMLIKRFYQGFRILRLFPKSQKYPYEQNLLKDIYEVLDRYSFPVMISLDEIDITGDKAIEWEKVLEIADTYKNMPLIIDGGSSKELMFNSYFFTLLKNSTNIFLNTHNLFGINQIEDVASISGPKRLLFDSYYPFYDPFISVERIMEAGIPEKSKKMIAAKNIERLYSGIKIS